MASRATKRRKTGHSSDVEDSSKIQKAFFKNAASWDLEHDYEARKRKLSKKNAKKDRENNRLPIKTQDGRVVQHIPAAAPNNGNDDDDDVGSDNDWLEGKDEARFEELIREQEAEQRRRYKENQREDAENELPERVRITQAKEELATLAIKINQDPEENIGSLKRLAEIGQSNLQAVQKLALAAQMAVYKDVIPGYRIRPLAEDGPNATKMLSKEARQLRNFEQAIVSGYGVFVKGLARYAKTGSKEEGGVASVAIACACSLVLAVPHFNFRGDLFKIIVGRLSRRKVDADSIRCVTTLQELLRDDEEGRASLEAVALLSKMVKAREFQVDEGVLNLFLHLRLLSTYMGTASFDRADARPDHGAAPKSSKKKRDFLTKNQRKDRREHKQLEREMDQANAIVDHEERDRMQSEMLKIVFACYFRILKARVPHLMGAVLEGLARYARLINQDFFGDLLEALKDLIRHSMNDSNIDICGGNVLGGDDDDDDDDGVPMRNLTRESLLCTVTAFALLAGQDAHNARNQLHLDLTFFTTTLFSSLLALSTNPDLELTPKAVRLRAELTQHLNGPANSYSASSKVNAHTTTVLLIRSLTSVLLPRWGMRAVPPLRLAAFTKHLMTASLQLPEKSAQAVLALVADIIKEHGPKASGMWRTDERRGDGAWLPLSTSIEGSNPRAATIWEGELLRLHFSPAVREGLALLEKSISVV